MPPIPPVPGLAFQLESYAGKVKALGVVWLIYAAVALVTGIAALFFANAFLSGHFGPWMNGPWGSGTLPPMGFGPAILRFAWVFLLVRVSLAALAGFGLLEHAQWGRIVAIVAAVVNIYKFPFGIAMGIWTLIVLLGYRNSTLYDQL
jgi:hypothetical protein